MRLLPFPDLSEEHLRAWERLAERAAEPNPFFEPGFAAIVAETIGDDGAGLLIAEGEGGEWIGCMAAKPIRKAGLGVALSTWNHPYSFLGTPLVDRERLDEYAAALLALAEGRDLGRLLVLRDLGNGPVMEALRRALAASAKVEVAFERSFERATLERRPEPDYVETLKSSRRSRLRGQRRKLEKAFDGEIAFCDLRCGDGAAETFLELEAAGWKGRAGTAMACDPGAAEFFKRMCAWFDERDRFRLRALKGGERTVAMICSVAAGDTVFGFKICFDEEFRSMAPGLQLQVDDFFAFHERHLEDYLDSCGEPDVKTLKELWPDRRKITSLVIGRRGGATGGARAALEFYFSPTGRRLAARLRNRGKEKS